MHSIHTVPYLPVTPTFFVRLDCKIAERSAVMSPAANRQIRCVVGNRPFLFEEGWDVDERRGLEEGTSACAGRCTMLCLDQRLEELYRSKCGCAILCPCFALRC